MSQTYTDPQPVPPAAADPAPKHGGWLAAILPVVLIAACSELGISVLSNSALPIYFTTGLKIPTSVYTLLMLPFFISEVLFKSPLGVLADKVGRRPLMLGGALVTVFTPLILIGVRYDPAAATAIITLLVFGILRALDGAGQAAIWPSLYAYVGDVVAEKSRGAAMGLLNVVYMAGLSLSLLIGGLVDSAFGPIFAHEMTAGEQFHNIGRQMGAHLHRGHAASLPPPVPITHHPGYYYPSFILASLLFALATFAALAVRERSRAGTAAAAAAVPAAEAGASGESVSWSGFLNALRTVPQFLGLAVVTFLGIGCIMPLVKKFALDEYGMTETAFGIHALGPAFVIALISVPVGHLADRWGKTQSVRAGFALCALGLWGIPLLHHFHIGILGFIGAVTVLGIGFVAAFPAWLALLADLGGEARRGTVFAAVSTAQGIGALGGVAVSGLLYDKISHIAPFVAASILVSLGTLLAFLFVRPQAIQTSEKKFLEN